MASRWRLADTYENPTGNSFATPHGLVGFGRNRPSLLAGIRGFYRGQLWSGEMDGNRLQFGRLQQQQLARRRGRPLDTRSTNLDFEFEVLYQAKPDPNAEWLYHRGAWHDGEPDSFQGRGDGFESRFEVTRNW